VADYRVGATKAMRRDGAKILGRGGDFDVLEGPWTPRRLVMLKFADRAAAKAFYDSQTYRHARTLREGAGVMRMVVVDGVN